MLKSLATAILLCAVTIPPSLAQVQANSSGAQGTMGNTTNLTGSGPSGTGRLSTWSTGPQSTVNLPTGLGNLAGAPPPTVLDSLVKDSGYNDMIYGDEGTFGPPPYNDFLPIGAGLGGAGATVSGTTNYGGLASMWDLSNPSATMSNFVTSVGTFNTGTATLNPAEAAAANSGATMSAAAATAANQATAASEAQAAAASGY